MLKNYCFKKYFNLNFIKKFILKNKIDLHKKNFHKKTSEYHLLKLFNFHPNISHAYINLIEYFPFVSGDI